MAYIRSISNVGSDRVGPCLYGQVFFRLNQVFGFESRFSG